MTENLASEDKKDPRRLAWRYGILTLIPFAAGLAALAIPDEATRLAVGLFCGGLAVLATVVFSIAFWQGYSGVPFRWFLAGAATWIVGVIVFKTIFGLWLYLPVLYWLKASLPHAAYLVMGSIYGGLATGLFEGGAALAMALIWKSFAREGRRAVAIGLGAGSFEALLIGLGVFIAGATALFSLSGRVAMLVGFKDILATTQLPWMLQPVERIIATSGHIAFRTLIIFAVATGRWRYFWYGFLLFTLVDGVAGYFVIAGLLDKISTWWIELALVYNVIIAIPIIIWCLKRWPAGELPAESR